MERIHQEREREDGSLEQLSRVIKSLENQVRSLQEEVKRLKDKHNNSR